MKPLQAETKRWILFIFLALAWGSSFLIMKRGLRSFSFDQIGALRIIFAWAFASLLALKHLNKITKSNWKPLFWVGLLGNGLPYFLFPLAITRVDSGLVGILNSMVPLFTLLTGALFFGAYFKKVQIAGVIVGFLGAGLLLFPNAEIGVSTNLIYGSFAIVSTICYALGVNIISTQLKSLNSFAITALSLFFVGPISLIYLLSTDFGVVMVSDPQAWGNLGLVAILGIVNSALAIIVFNQLIKTSSPLFASSVTYAIPIVALFWGIFDGEKIGLYHFFGIATILVGVWLVNRKRRVVVSRARA